MGNEPVRQEPPLRETRERTVEVLCAQFARDALETQEFERRIDLAYRAETAVQLAALTADLPALPADETPARRAVAPAGAARVPAEQVQASQFVVAIMGGTERKGSWVPARNIYAAAMMGGIGLDFRDARFGPGITEVTIFAFMGGVEVIVPPGLHVQSDGIAIMGGFDHRSDGPPPGPDAPVLRINGVALMGGFEISTRLPGETAGEARKRRRLERKKRLPGG